MKLSNSVTSISFYTYLEMILPLFIKQLGIIYSLSVAKKHKEVLLCHLFISEIILYEVLLNYNYPFEIKKITRISYQPVYLYFCVGRLMYNINA